MKVKSFKIGAAIAFLLFMFTCGWIVVTPCPNSTKVSNAPQYIEGLWPPSDVETHLGCYIKLYIIPPSAKGVGVQVNTSAIWKLELPQADDKVQSSFPTRVSMFVDGKEVPVIEFASGGGTYYTNIDGNETQLDLAGWYFLGSNQFVFPGEHQAKIKIHTRSGETLEYEWHFRIKVW